MIALTRDQLRNAAPSIFTTTPYHRLSSRYKLAGTADLVDMLEATGLHPVRVNQSTCRIPDKRPFVKHMIRFRRAEDLDAAVASEVFETILTNSFDGSSAYCLECGLHRVCCLNGLVCPTSALGSIRIYHKGGGDFGQRIIDASRQVIEHAPTVMNTVAEWKGITLDRSRQLAFAEQAMELKPSTAIQPIQLLTSRRPADDTDQDGNRNLWITMNVIEEHLIRGGLQARNQRGRRISTRPIRSVTADLAINRGLWRLAESYSLN